MTPACSGASRSDSLVSSAVYLLTELMVFGCVSQWRSGLLNELASRTADEMLMRTVAPFFWINASIENLWEDAALWNYGKY